MGIPPVSPVYVPATTPTERLAGFACTEDTPISTNAASNATNDVTLRSIAPPLVIRECRFVLFMFLGADAPRP